jgi:hypothetical protein
MWALCQGYDMAGNPKDLELAGKFSRFVSQAKFWEPEVEPKFFPGAERGHFKGHIHSYVGALIGILEYAQRANDPWLKEFVRRRRTSRLRRLRRGQPEALLDRSGRLSRARP